MTIARIRYTILLAALCAPAFAALPVVPGKDQPSMLKSSDPKLAANKKLVYDFFRVVLRGFRIEEADKYMAVDYMQHNPNAETVPERTGAHEIWRFENIIRELRRRERSSEHVHRADSSYGRCAGLTRARAGGAHSDCSGRQ